MRTALNETLRTRLRRVIGKAAFALVLVGAVGALGAPAMAHDWDGDRGYGWHDHDRWREHEAHERWEQRERWEHRYWHPEYRPQVYYAPPPTYYRPQAYYSPQAYTYSQPSLSVVIPFGDR